MFTARRIDGAAAAAIGLVDQAVPDDELDATVDALAAEIAANSAGTNRIVKRLLRERLDRNRAEALLLRAHLAPRPARRHGRADGPPQASGLTTDAIGRTVSRRRGDRAPCRGRTARGGPARRGAGTRENDSAG